ncbi:DUF1684 domain-containing protein [Hymenobacter busanensis]|uniref:DUF1684 domain-containing protein n=1 Tax=Hymenobacter busanensis TaxID=2607656 RepID=A0A7L4ZXI8_9BACT|nr:DUF1684 domain-containing protein [Hymenobacter busanensis]KAA9332105.1 DUF1684 domain-containing protein [Hymenobacter busanensis]QHJ07556.1 DUF1684 domain-containing protein [Hymenobacter busanensis]
MVKLSVPKILLGLGLLVVLGYIASDLLISDDQYAYKLRQERKQKNEQFRSHRDSPLPEELHEKFDSLHYYPIDRAWRLTARLERLPAGDTLSLALTDGGADKYTRFARATFEWQGQPQTLTLLRRVSKTDSTLFVPFTDKTNGRGSYGGGRYLDVETPARRDREVVLDFNRTYNPYCAYGGNFACPMPPKENWLTVEVPVGEKSYKE